jgi:hypothetical protein
LEETPRNAHLTIIGYFRAFGHCERNYKGLFWTMPELRLDSSDRSCILDALIQLHPMYRAFCFVMIAFSLVGCTTARTTREVGFPGHQDRLRTTGDYDQREQIDDDQLDYHHGNFRPSLGPDDPDPDFLYLM